MLLKRRSQVEVVDGTFAGCFGIVRELWLDDGRAQVGVELWHGAEGRFIKWIFNPESLKPRQVAPITAEMMELAAAQQELEEVAA